MSNGEVYNVQACTLFSRAWIETSKSWRGGIEGMDDCRLLLRLAIGYEGCP